MLDRNLFTIEIEGTQATIRLSFPGCTATCMWLADRVPSVSGYVSHQLVATESDPRLEFVLSDPDINNCVDQAFLSLSD